MPSSALEPVNAAMIRRIGSGVRALTAVCLALGILGGCSTPKLVSRWQPVDIIADGKAAEWPGDPQYVDDDPDLAVQVLSDSQSLSLCIETKSETLTRQLLSDGLTLWLDPNGGKDMRFGIHVRGGSPRALDGRHPPEAGGLLPSGNNRRPGDDKPPSLPLEPITQVAITYGDATGPLTMAMDEVRRTGIDIGMGQGADRALVYEFNIAFKAAPSLEALVPGMVIGVGIL